MILLEKQIQNNWNKILEIIESNITDKRKRLLTRLYSSYEERMAVMPASYNVYMHNCFPGGYVEHILRVIQLSDFQSKIYEFYNIKPNFTEEERIFAALNHDLGKIGTIEEPYYIFETGEYWKRKGNIYKTNTLKTGYMKVPDRSLFLLQQHGIELTENEYLAIKLHDGLFDEGNKAYYTLRMPEVRLQNQLVVVLHLADFMAATIERKLYLDKLIKVNKIEN